MRWKALFWSAAWGVSALAQNVTFPEDEAPVQPETDDGPLIEWWVILLIILLSFGVSVFLLFCILWKRKRDKDGPSEASSVAETYRDDEENEIFTTSIYNKSGILLPPQVVAAYSHRHGNSTAELSGPMAQEPATAVRTMRMSDALFSHSLEDAVPRPGDNRCVLWLPPVSGPLNMSLALAPSLSQRSSALPLTRALPPPEPSE
ncbi:hypothetical protein DIPPA_16863 [Diplonema papillatum]|nr:hypothetical protein DIPPA_16863 [Diplonema papillatum]